VMVQDEIIYSAREVVKAHATQPRHRSHQEASACTG